VSKYVEFTGFVPDVRAVLSAADVAAMPSLQEGLGVAVLEAMAMGKPVVSSDAGGLPESVVHGETGIVTPAGDAEALADALAAVLRDPARARSMGRAGRERVVEHFDRPRVAERVLRLYADVLGEGEA
jgi:glycosyltransferase involved in cell wall biosynthesis